MKKSNLIIAIFAMLVIAGIVFGVYFGLKSSSESVQVRDYSSAASSGRSRSILDRLYAEIDAGVYDKKKKTTTEEKAGEEAS